MIVLPLEKRERQDALLAAGARVVVPITVEASELCAALRLVADGRVGSPGPRAGVPAAGLGLLTAREVEVLELAAEGRSAVDIAAALHIEVTTVNSHCRHIYEKLGVHDRRELEIFARPVRAADEEERVAPVAQTRERLAHRRWSPQPRDHDRAVVIDFCQALGTRWRGHGA